MEKSSTDSVLTRVLVWTVQTACNSVKIPHSSKNPGKKFYFLVCVKSLLSESSIVLDLRWRHDLTKFGQNLLFFIYFFLDGVIQDVFFLVKVRLITK